MGLRCRRRRYRGVTLSNAVPGTSRGSSSVRSSSQASSSVSSGSLSLSLPSIFSRSHSNMARKSIGSPLQLSRVHWVRPQIVVEVTYLTWTDDGLLRQVSYQGQREDKPARQVVRAAPRTRDR